MQSYTRSQIACSDAFDFAYTYDADHDQALSYSHYARREQVGSGACISYTYADLDDYMSYYVYEKPSNPSESLGRFNRFGRYGDHPGYASGSLIDRLYFYYYDSARPGRATRVGEYNAHRNLGYTSGYLFSTSANLTYGTGGMLTQASNGDQQLTYGRKLAKPSSFTVMGQSTTNFHFEDGTAAGYQTPSGDKHHFLGATERKNSVPHRMRMPEGYYDYPLGKWVFELKDYLGTPRVTFTDINGDGVIRAADDILEQQTLYPFGQYAFGATNSSVAGYTGDDVDFTGHQLRGGQINRLHAMHDMRARYYVSGLAMFGGVDPLADQFAAWTPYHYTHNNPINLVDPTGMSAIHSSGSIASARREANRENIVLQSALDGIETTIVEEEEGGTYTVIGGVNDGSTDIVTQSGELVGQSLTPYSFMDDDEKFVVGAQIDPLSMDGQGFLDREILSDNPSLLTYMSNAKGGEPLDYKTLGIKDKGLLTARQYVYRGSLLNNGRIASARDIGNVGAGMVAGRLGLSWLTARAGFDGLQTAQDLGWGSLRNGPSVEGRTSVTAQAFGYRLGLAIRATDK